MKQIQIAAPSFDESELEMVRGVLASGWVTQGPMVSRFESIVAETHGVKHALATTSCTAALHLAGLALGLGPGDEVIVPAFTWITSANTAEYCGAKAVFADVDLATFNIDVEALAQAITPRTRVVVVVHLFGLAAPMDEISAICRPRGIKIIEDAACAIGTTYNSRPIGAIGDLGCFSFHPRKVVTTGEGGMVTTNDDDLATAVRSYRNHGATGLADGEERGPWNMATFNQLGFNLRLSDIQAAVGVAQMAKLDGLLAYRRARAGRYTKLLGQVPDLQLPTAGDLNGHTYQSYVIRVTEGGRERRNAVMTALEAQGIQTRPGTHAVHRLGYYAQKYGLRSEDFPNAVLAEDTTITLPILPDMTDAQQDLVIDQLTRAMAH